MSTSLAFFSSCTEHVLSYLPGNGSPAVNEYGKQIKYRNIDWKQPNRSRSFVDSCFFGIFFLEQGLMVSVFFFVFEFIEILYIEWADWEGVEIFFFLLRG